MTLFSSSHLARAVPIVLALMALGFAQVAHANLRAPLLVRALPSSALLKPEGQFTVLGETLRFDCTDQQCVVEARYRIQAAGAASAMLTFVLPSNALTATTTARLGEQALAFRETPLTEEQRAGLKRTEAEEDFGEWIPHDKKASDQFVMQLAQGEFEAPFQKGENEVAIRYVQPFGSQERDHGYSKKGRLLKTFRYELWPLKGWALDDRFVLDVRISAPRRALGYFQRKLHTPVSIACGPYVNHLRKPVEVIQKGDRMEYAITLGREFPDHLFCSIGDEDILPRASGER